MTSNLTNRAMLIAALQLAIGSFVFGADPMAGDKGHGPTAAQSPPTDQPRGLLVDYFVTAKPPGESGEADPPARAPVGSGVQPAMLTSLPAENEWELAGPPPESNLPMQLPTVSEALGCTACDCCPDPLWVHRSGVFADLLYLRPGNIDYVYAVAQTGTLPTDSPTGPVGRVGFDPALGYRLGVTHYLTDCSSLQASYTWFQDDTQSTINAAPGTVLLFQPGLPSIPNVGGSSVAASARYNIRFQQADLDYRGLLYGSCNSALNYFAGLRYANLKQDFHAQEDVGAPTGLTQAISHISFDGFGIGMGLDGMRRSANSGCLVYGRSSASFVSGEFKANYRQLSQFGPNSTIGNDLVDYRVLTILQTELGVGWQNATGNIRLTAGYQFAGWFNSLTTGSYILGVQNRQFNNLNETITFDGLVTRLLWQF